MPKIVSELIGLGTLWNHGEATTPSFAIQLQAIWIFSLSNDYTFLDDI
jgi:hypothetical protein